jgi:Arc/MetJ-type ribon-helix-helix transcriptional regulator
MKQLNIKLDSHLAKGLEILIKRRRLAGKTEAVRVAVREAVERLLNSERAKRTFRDSLGCAMSIGKLNPQPRFKTEDDLW